MTFHQSKMQAIDIGDSIPSISDLLNEIKRKEETAMKTGVYCSCCMNCENFDPETKEIKVGDQVRVARMDTNDPLYTPYKKAYLGQIGRVKRIGINVVVQFSEDEHIHLNRCWLELVKKAEKGFTGKVVCVKSDNYYFTEGKVYSIHDGVICDDTGRPYWERKCWQDTFRITDISQPHICSVTFIEFKGE